MPYHPKCCISVTAPDCAPDLLRGAQPKSCPFDEPGGDHAVDYAKDLRDYLGLSREENLIGVTRLGLDLQKSSIQSATGHEGLELLDDVGGKALALLLKVLLQARPVFLNNLVENSLIERNKS